MGVFKPLSGEVSLHMDAPPEEVWALVSDVTRIGEFSPETFSIDLRPPLAPSLYRQAIVALQTALDAIRAEEAGS